MYYSSPQFYPSNMHHSRCKHAFSIRVETVWLPIRWFRQKPTQGSTVFSQRMNLGSAGQGLIKLVIVLLFRAIEELIFSSLFYTYSLKFAHSILKIKSLKKLIMCACAVSDNNLWDGKILFIGVGLQMQTQFWYIPKNFFKTFFDLRY